MQYHVYVVNGVRIFAKGANWVPPDSFEARATKEVLCGLLDSAKAAGMNFLRIWGGGIYPQDEFYECADEIGMLLEQDCIFSNGQYQYDPAFLQLVGEEVQYQARRLASHPSLFMWSGSNELAPAVPTPTWWDELFLKTVFPNITSIDASRPVWAACPATAWASGVDPKNNLPNGDPFAATDYRSVPFGEVHAYWFRMCDTLESCRNCVDDSFYALSNFASEYGWIGMHGSRLCTMDSAVLGLASSGCGCRTVRIC
jgi:hypothetical protein